ncbi:hypothetical protein DMX03_11685 [Pseudomonas koreensis]|nr:hypothetical protein DMX03_11685 [Pseudomonas koreensis]TSB49154.1 hypothetical protein FEE99_26285 [Pseudomonas sp. ef1]
MKRIHHAEGGRKMYRTRSCKATLHPVGASLLAKASDQTTSMLNVPTSSRAGSLPQWKYWCVFRTPTSQSLSSATPAPPSPPASCRPHSTPATTRTR